MTENQYRCDLCRESPVDRRLLNDLKADGYDPVGLEAVPSDARKKKSVYINLERSVDAEGDQ